MMKHFVYIMVDACSGGNIEQNLVDCFSKNGTFCKLLTVLVILMRYVKALR